MCQKKVTGWVYKAYLWRGPQEEPRCVKSVFEDSAWLNYLDLYIISVDGTLLSTLGKVYKAYLGRGPQEESGCVQIYGS